MRRSLASKLLPAPLHSEIERTVEAKNERRADAKLGIVSTATMKERRQVAFLAFAQLWQMGYRLQSVKSLGERHIRALVERWDAEGLSAGTLATRISYLSTFCTWIGKAGMVKDPTHYCDPARVKRVQVTTTDKSWQAQGLIPEDVIAQAREIDERMALYLTLQHDFGLRVKESIEFRPLNAIVDDGRSIELYDGTKGGRRRTVPIDTEEQRRTIAWALEVAKKTRGGRLRWPNKTWRQAQCHFYSLLRRKLKISRKDAGVTAHGLRHGFTHEDYHRQTGLPTPVEGGALGIIDRETHDAARRETSRKLGHRRESISSAYYGSYGHGLRSAKVVVTSVTFKIWPRFPFV